MADPITPDPKVTAGAPTSVAPLQAPETDAPAPTAADALTTAVRGWQATFLSNTAVSRDPDSWAAVDAAIPALVQAILEV